MSNFNNFKNDCNNMKSMMCTNKYNRITSINRERYTNRIKHKGKYQLELLMSCNKRRHPEGVSSGNQKKKTSNNKVK